MAFTAWGKEVGGLQAGLGFPAGAKRAYRHGETVTLVVRVRNVGKEAVKFEYVKQFLDEDRPAATDAGGKNLPQSRTSMPGIHGPTGVSLEPGKEVVLETRMHGASGSPHKLLPAGDGGKATTKELPLFVGTGKVGLQYERVIGNSSSGFLDKPDPSLGKLATGTLELEVKGAATERPKALTPDEAIRAAGDARLAKGFNATKPPVEFRVESVAQPDRPVAGVPDDAAGEKWHGSDGTRLYPPPHPNPSQTRFVAVLSVSAVKQFDRAGVRDVTKHLKGKTVRVTGTIFTDGLRLYGTPTEVRVTVDDLSQLEVID